MNLIFDLILILYVVFIGVCTFLFIKLAKNNSDTYKYYKNSINENVKILELLQQYSCVLQSLNYRISAIENHLSIDRQQDRSQRIQMH